MSLFSSELKSHGTGGSFLTDEMYIEVGGCFKTFEFVLTAFCQIFPSVWLHVPEIVPCSVVCNEYSVCNGLRFRNLPEADKHESGVSMPAQAR